MDRDETIVTVEGIRERRAAENELAARRVNERIQGESGGAGAAPAFVCECSRADCRRLIKLSSRDYERVRSEPRRFAVVPEHVDSELEFVVEVNEGYVLVEKHGDAGELAEDQDPRL